MFALPALACAGVAGSSLHERRRVPLLCLDRHTVVFVTEVIETEAAGTTHRRGQTLLAPMAAALGDTILQVGCMPDGLCVDDGV